MFDLDINTPEIMISTIFGLIAGEIWSIIKRKYSESKPILKLKNVKLINTFWFILSYVFPLVTIIYLLLINQPEPTFKNIALFVIICSMLVYNVLMSHVITIYKMIVQSTKKNTQSLNQTQEFFDSVYKEIIELKKENKTK